MSLMLQDKNKYRYLKIPIPERTANDTTEITQWIRGLDLKLFEGLRLPSLRKIAAYLVLREINAGDVIVRQGQIGESFFILISGTVDVYVYSKEDVVARDEKRKEDREAKKKQEYLQKLSSLAPRSRTSSVSRKQSASRPNKKAATPATPSFTPIAPVTEDDLPVMSLDLSRKPSTASISAEKINIIDSILVENDTDVISSTYGRNVASLDARGAKNWFGEISLRSDNAPATASIISKTPCIMLEMSRQYYEISLKKYVDMRGSVSDEAEAIEFISSNFLLSKFDNAKQNAIRYNFEERTYPRGSVIIQQGDEMRGIHFIKEGMCQVRKTLYIETPNRYVCTAGYRGKWMTNMQHIYYLQQRTKHVPGHEQRRVDIDLAEIGPHCYFGERPLLERSRIVDKSIIALSKVTTYELTRESILRLFRGTHVLRMRSIDAQKRILENNLIRLKLQSIQAADLKVPAFLKQHMRGFDETEGEEENDQITVRSFWGVDGNLLVDPMQKHSRVPKSRQPTSQINDGIQQSDENDLGILSSAAVAAHMRYPAMRLRPVSIKKPHRPKKSNSKSFRGSQTARKSKQVRIEEEEEEENIIDAHIGFVGSSSIHDFENITHKTPEPDVFHNSFVGDELSSIRPVETTSLSEMDGLAKKKHVPRQAEMLKEINRYTKEVNSYHPPAEKSWKIRKQEQQRVLRMELVNSSKDKTMYSPMKQTPEALLLRKPQKTNWSSAKTPFAKSISKKGKEKKQVQLLLAHRRSLYTGNRPSGSMTAR